MPRPLPGGFRPATAAHTLGPGRSPTRSPWAWLRGVFQRRGHRGRSRHNSGLTLCNAGPLHGARPSMSRLTGALVSPTSHTTNSPQHLPLQPVADLGVGVFPVACGGRAGRRGGCPGRGRPWFVAEATRPAGNQIRGRVAESDVGCRSGLRLVWVREGRPGGGAEPARLQGVDPGGSGLVDHMREVPSNGSSLAAGDGSRGERPGRDPPEVGPPERRRHGLRRELRAVASPRNSGLQLL